MAVRGAYLVVAASLLMMLHCCNHVCLCEENGISEDSEDDDLSLEVEDEEEPTVSVFEPTHEWKMVEEGQPIPPGLHVRMNMETGKKEAKLMDDVTTAQESEKTADSSVPGSETNTPQNKQTETPPKKAKPGGGGGGGAVPSPGFFFRGDQRRAHHYGHLDRRGIINLRRRMLTHRDVAAALRKFDESNAQLSKRPPGRITHSQPAPGDPSLSQKADAPSGQGVTVVQQDKEGGRTDRPMMHRELKEMLRHTKTLARKSATIPELLQALEELEYHVHHIENAKELNSIGGLVVVVRLLNHTHPDIRSSAAHVIGAATQSNPHVQSEVLDYGGLQLLCAFINSGEPELVQRRGLFALSALLRGNTQPQLAFVQECRGLMQLGLDFQERAMPTQLKIVTLLTDLLHEQDQLMHNSEELKSLLHSSVQEHGWCQHVPSLLHSKTLSPTEKALQAMSALQHLCDFTSHLPRLQELQSQFEAAVKQEEDEVSQSLLDHSQELLRNIRNRNKEL